jgi:diguanylate cyclase (GGDEF)-like protein
MVQHLSSRSCPGAWAADPHPVPQPRLPRPVLVALLALALALAAYAILVATGTGGDGVVLQEVLYFTVMAGAAALAAARALAGRDRLVWGLLAGGMVVWLIGDVIWEVAEPAGISIADAFYLGFYAAALPAIVVLLRRRASGTLATLWADGWVAALTVASVSAYFFVEPVLQGIEGDVWTQLVNIAYPVGDTLLLALVIGAVVALRGGLRASWMMLAAALALLAISDGIYLNLAWTSGYEDGTLLEAGWPGAALLLSWAAWRTYGERAERRVVAERAPIGWPVLWGGGSLAIVALLGFTSAAHVLPVSLALAGVLSVFGRLMLTDGQNRRLAGAASLQALTDPITGLGNHRALTLDLHEALATTAPSRRLLVAVFDLNGFKDYNDLFGHPAGDALLQRLGSRLGAAMAGGSRAYRMGGDEFCVLAEIAADAQPQLLLARCDHALSENGDGFSVTAARGHVLAQPGRTKASAALSAADERMYAAKRNGRRSSLQQATDVLLALAHERDPRTVSANARVAELADATARELGLEEDLVAQVTHAARLHDVGKLALPESLLSKPGPLDDAEVAFVRTHTLVGERILNAAPALAPVGRLIRSSHERMDGAGYPDGLAGDEIPLGARIVFVCDAYEGMTAERPHRPALTEAEALHELRRNAGTQFDPLVVAAFAAAHARRAASGDAPALAA